MKTRILLLSTLLCLSACGESPLLNHVTEGERLSGLQEKPQSSCPFEFTKFQMCASIEWTVKPTDEKKGVFELKFWNLTRPSFVNPPGTVTARLWMPDMGHGSSPITVAQKKDSNGQTMVGQFVASDVYFVMGGHWEIWLELKENKKILDSAKMDIDI